MSAMIKLAFRNIKENKKWAMMTVMGISVSLMLITMVISFALGTYESLSNELLKTNDTWNETIFFDPSEDSFVNNLSDVFSKREGIERYWIQSHFGEILVDDNSGVSHVNLIEIQEGFTNTNPNLRFSIPNLIEGRLAVGPNEIVIASNLSSSKEEGFKIGDVIEVSDVNQTVHQMEIVGLTSNYINSVSGFDHINELLVFVEYKDDINLKHETSLNSAIPGYSSSSYNTLINSIKGYSLPNNTMFWSAIMLCGLVVLIIALSSASLIYNAFYLSLEQKVQQIGVLKSVGATNKQVGKMVYFEGILLTLVSITIGIFGGYWLAKLSLIYIGKTFSNIANSLYLFEPKITLPIVLVIYVIGILTVILPIRKSVKYANTVSPVEIIRNVSKKDDTLRYKKTPKWVDKIFGTSGILAFKNYDRDRKKHRSTGISLIIVIVLFITISSFVKTAKDMLSSYNHQDYDIHFINYYNSRENYRHEYEDIQDRVLKEYGVENVTTYKIMNLTGGVSQVPFKFKEKYSDFSNEEVYLGQALIVYPDESFVQYYGEKNLFNNVFVPKVVGTLLAPGNNGMKEYKVNDVIVDVKVGESYTFSFYNNESEGSQQFNFEDISIDLIVNDVPTSLLQNYEAVGVKFIMSESQFKRSGIEKYSSPDYQGINDVTLIKAENHEAVEKEIINMISEEQYTESEFLGYSLFNKTKDTLLLSSVFGTIDIASIIVSLFIVIICISNLLNVLASTARQRLKEYGVYRSVGMEIKELRKMLLYESVINSFIPLVLGLVLVVGVSYLMFILAETALSLESYSIDVMSLGYAVLLVIGVQVIQLFTSMQLLKKSNIVEDLKRMEM